MKYFAGLDLSEVKAFSLSDYESSIIERAFRENYTKLYGEIDYAPADQVIELLRKYVKLNLVELSVAACCGLELEDFTMALAVYMLPCRTIDTSITKVNAIIATLPNQAEIEELRNHKYSLDTIVALWKLIQPFKNKLDFTGFWHKSSSNLLRAANTELHRQIFEKIADLDRTKSKCSESNAQFAQTLALRYVYIIYILDYIRRRETGLDVLYNLYNTEYPGADAAWALRKLVCNTIDRLQKLPEQDSELGDPNTYHALLFRARESVWKRVAPHKIDPVKKAKVAP